MQLIVGALIAVIAFLLLRPKAAATNDVGVVHKNPDGSTWVRQGDGSILTTLPNGMQVTTVDPMAPRTGPPPAPSAPPPQIVPPPPVGPVRVTVAAPPPVLIVAPTPKTIPIPTMRYETREGPFGTTIQVPVFDLPTPGAPAPAPAPPSNVVPPYQSTMPRVAPPREPQIPQNMNDGVPSDVGFGENISHTKPNGQTIFFD